MGSMNKYVGDVELVIATSLLTLSALSPSSDEQMWFLTNNSSPDEQVELTINGIPY